MPKVSVVIPTHNRCALLKQTVQSVLNQTFQDFEIIIVDDASTDSTEDVVKNIADSRIKYVKNLEKLGVSATRNRGFGYSSGQFIAYLDDDDTWLPQMISEILNALGKSSELIGGVTTGRYVVDSEQGILDVILPKKDEYSFEDILLGGISILSSTVLVRRRCLEEIGGFDEDLNYYEEWELWLRLTKRFRFKTIKKPLVKCTHSESSATRDAQFRKKYGPIFLSKISPYIDDTIFKVLQRKLQSSYYYILGRRYILGNRIVEGRQELIRALKKYPYRKDAWFLLIGSLAGFRVYELIANLKKNLTSRIKLGF